MTSADFSIVLPEVVLALYAMAALMLVSSTIILTKSLRDQDEATRFHNKLEEARTEKLLMEVNGGKP